MHGVRTLHSETLVDRDDLLVATVSRRQFGDIDFVGLTRHGDTITVSIEQVPELIAALQRALEAGQ